MPVKRRKSKTKLYTLTPDAAFDAGDEYALSRALGLPPWHASPLWEDLEGPPPYGPDNLSVNLTRPAALEMRREILARRGRSDDSGRSATSLQVHGCAARGCLAGVRVPSLALVHQRDDRPLLRHRRLPIKASERRWLRRDGFSQC
jgi:hypothetical protein